MRITTQSRQLHISLSQAQKVLGSGQLGKVAGQFTAERLEKETKEAWPEASDPITDRPWAERKNDRDPGRAILVKSGSLRREVGTESQVDGKRIFVRGYVNGSASKYALTHQDGSPSRNIPQRRYMGLSERDYRRVEERIQKWIEHSL